VVLKQAEHQIATICNIFSTGHLGIRLISSSAALSSSADDQTSPRFVLANTLPSPQVRGPSFLRKFKVTRAASFPRNQSSWFA
jgi:hypothetical protein